MVQEHTVLQLTHFKKIGDNYHRLIWPARQLAKQMPAWRVINMLAEAKAHYEWAERADLLVLSQSLDLDLLPVIRRRRARGLKTLAEYADNFYEPPPSSSAAGQSSSPLACQRYELLLNACDAIIVTGPGLRDLLASRFDKDIHILENHYPYELPDFETIWHRPGKTFAIGWGGSPGHVADLLSIAPLLRRLSERHGQIRIHLMGDEGLIRQTRIPPERLVFKAWGSIDDYFDFLDDLQLGVVPLIDTPFNRCRSDIKAIEMISRGVLPLLPPLLPYRGILEATGMAPYHSLEELEARILHYLDNPSALEADARRLYDYVKARRLGQARTERRDLYQSMMPPRPYSQDWPMGPGYHEVQGPPLEDTPSGRILQRFAKQPVVRPAQAALREVRDALADNPQHPDLALLALTLAAQAGERGWRDEAAACQARFPRDLRFTLLLLRQARDPARRAPLWHDLLARLEKERPAQREFYRREIIDIMCRELAMQMDDLSSAERLLGLFPDALPLRHALALAYEQRGEYPRALESFEILSEAKQTSERNSEYLSKVSATWLDTWRDILEERCRLARGASVKRSSN